jgi:EcoEI R protein C-terminal
MEKWAEIRRRVLSGELSRRQACREYKLHWETIQKVLSHAEPPGYRKSQPRRRPKLAPFLPRIAEILEADTRAKLLQGLAENGFGHDQLAEMQKIIDAEKSDLFDVLAHVAYALPPLSREERAENARVAINSHFNIKQQAFLDFVLSHYVSVGVEELDQEKLLPLLRLRYHDSIADAIADLGRPEEIGSVFTGFQKYLYQEVA